MPETIRIRFPATGGARMIYSDKLDIRRLGPHTTTRASHVEPFGDNWYVDLTPVGGPACFADADGKPFTKREDALAFEKAWLEQRWLPHGGPHGAT